MKDIRPQRHEQPNRHISRHEKHNSRKRSFKQSLQLSLKKIKVWTLTHKKKLGIVAAVLLVCLAGFGLYRFGYAQGQQAQKKANEQLIAEARRSNMSPFDALRNRTPSKTLRGELQAITDTSVTVKPRDGDPETVQINKDTVVSDAKNKKIELKTLKKGGTVIVTTTTQEDKTVARRIRLLSND